MVREVGFDAVTMDGIAQRAAVGKTTLYRRWKTRDALVAEALDRLVRTFAVPDTGSTRADLVQVMRGTVGMYRDPATKMLLSGLVAAMARSPRIASAVRDGFVKVRADVMRAVLARGVERGDVRRDIDLTIAIDLLRGPLLMRGLLTGDRIDESLAITLVDIVLRGLAPSAPRKASARSR